MTACLSDIPVVRADKMMDWLEGDDFLEKGERCVSGFGMGKVRERGIATGRSQ